MTVDGVPLALTAISDEDAAPHDAVVEVAHDDETVDSSRPLRTGDHRDARFDVGATAKLAVAYGDPDETGGGWEDHIHVQSSDLGGIVVGFA